MKKDITDRDDLLLLIDLFYKKLLADDTISYLFTDVAKINLAHHLPVLIDFWDSLLFQSDTYHKNAMQPHIALHQQSPLQKHHFETWLRYFNESVDTLFAGEKAFMAKEKARSIATVMQIKISQLDKYAATHPPNYGIYLFFLFGYSRSCTLYP
jgi:hemoglobin